MSKPSKNMPTATRPKTLRWKAETGSRSSLAPMVAPAVPWLVLDDIVQFPCSLGRGSFDDRDALDLDQHGRVGEAGDGDGGAGGEVGAEQLGPDLRHPGGVARVGEEHGHGDDVLQRRPGFLQ